MNVAICFSRPSDPGIAMVIDLDQLPIDMVTMVLDRIVKNRESDLEWIRELAKEGYYEIALPYSFCESEALYKARVKMPCTIDVFVTAYVNEKEEKNEKGCAFEM